MLLLFFSSLDCDILDYSVITVPWLSLHTQDRCQREKCKYFHPPLHIKERLVSAGKQFGAMMSNTYMASTPAYPPTAIPAVSFENGRVMHVHLSMYTQGYGPYGLM